MYNLARAIRLAGATASQVLLSPHTFLQLGNLGRYAPSTSRACPVNQCGGSSVTARQNAYGFFFLADLAQALTIAKQLFSSSRSLSGSGILFPQRVQSFDFALREISVTRS